MERIYWEREGGGQVEMLLTSLSVYGTEWGVQYRTLLGGASASLYLAVTEQGAGRGTLSGALLSFSLVSTGQGAGCGTISGNVVDDRRSERP